MSAEISVRSEGVRNYVFAHHGLSNAQFMVFCSFWWSFGGSEGYLP